MLFNLTVEFIFTMLLWTRTLCTTFVPDVELKVLLLVDGVSVLPAVVGVDIITWVVSVGPSTEVLLLVDGVFLLVVSGLPAVVGAVVITWVVSAGPFAIQMYM